METGYMLRSHGREGRTAWPGHQQEEAPWTWGHSRSDRTSDMHLGPDERGWGQSPDFQGSTSVAAQTVPTFGTHEL